MFRFFSCRNLKDFNTKLVNYFGQICFSLSLSLLLSPTVSNCWHLGGMMSSQAGGGATGQ